MRGRLARLVVLGLASMTLVACWIEVTAVGPSAVGRIVIFSEPALIRPERTGGFCPATPPLVARFTLVIRDERGVDWRVREVALRFYDRQGVLGSDAAFTDRDLERLFGSSLVPARTSRRFDFSPRFGCVGDPVGTLRVHVLLVDQSGAAETGTASLTVL